MPEAVAAPGGRDPIVEQLDEAIDAVEDVDWQKVEGMTSLEASALQQRLVEARDATVHGGDDRA